ncbi:MAG: sigma-70 family RNA polymerase sigma factor [Candidatus Omnitrophota bacterium]|nr:sigma-70 family RNA polymerase sigma factor [Candidatus Omnitrophota bacterium]MBU1895117.1 sigma-70 family RNA polymerase sigma factor [Candidatus Omnitrophota bacterium]
MDFETLFNKIAPRLKKIAKYQNRRGFFFGEEDLYQEMCIYLWSNFKDGRPVDMNEAYIVKGCEFHVLNYLRKQRKKIKIISLDKPLDENGCTLKDFLPDSKKSVDIYVDANIAIEGIKDNVITKREEEVFALLFQGYKIREIGKKLGISHVRVIKIKRRITEKWQKKSKERVTISS